MLSTRPSLKFYILAIISSTTLFFSRCISFKSFKNLINFILYSLKNLQQPFLHRWRWRSRWRGVVMTVSIYCFLLERFFYKHIVASVYFFKRLQLSIPKACLRHSGNYEFLKNLPARIDKFNFLLWYFHN